ncbi:hypothetical protein D3C72_1503700 [compost metagenome]
MRRGLLHERFERICTLSLCIEKADRLQSRALLLRPQHLGALGVVAQRMADPCNIHDGGQLLGTQQGHGCHRNATGLDHAEPACHQHGVVGAAQQHTVARHQAHLAGQHMGDSVGPVLQIGIAPAHAFGLYAQPVAAPLFHMAVQQLGGTVQSLGKLQLRQLENIAGLQLGRRQVVGSKSIDMGGVGHGLVS